MCASVSLPVCLGTCTQTRACMRAPVLNRAQSIPDFRRAEFDCFENCVTVCVYVCVCVREAHFHDNVDGEGSFCDGYTRTLLRHLKPGLQIEEFIGRFVSVGTWSTFENKRKHLFSGDINDA